MHVLPASGMVNIKGQAVKRKRNISKHKRSKLLFS